MVGINKIMIDMKEFSDEKLKMRRYIWFRIDSYLSTFFFLAFAQIVFTPYGSNDYADFKFYLCLVNALVMTLFFHGRSIRRLIIFIRNKESVPEKWYKN